ncbi:PAS domain S-box-containing protein [Flavobacterium endophyticum]|uniref:histidine kinase n=1 Tax=Flavobacterium endophyticum TaxID=1540163 RepID=A0A495M341_9FLAO|nr:PAS domain S-box protein [Flavobacterium endophyticum]RKS19023.1 PAS domain S-box-containing protein [Flavobacterium endophyticum]
MEQYTNNISRRQIRHTLDSLMEGIQVIDFNWRYLYVNTVMAQAIGPEDNFRILTMMDKYPGIENTDIFKVLQDCMINRTPDRLEIEFVYLDHSVRWFDVSIIAVEEGICIMSLDITAHKLAEEKSEKAARLYAFISQVNQHIVRVKDEAALFHNSCHIAVEFGKFKIAWIGLFNHSEKNISIVDHSGIPDENLSIFTNLPYLLDDSQHIVLRTGTHYICNDIETAPCLPAWKSFAKEMAIESYVVLPVKKLGIIIGTFNLYSTIPNFFNSDELRLLTEMMDDISFALDAFEKAKRHDIAEELIIKNEKRFRALIEKSTDIKTLSTIEGKIIYASPSIKKILGYTSKEFISLPFLAIFHPEDTKAIINLRERLLKSRGKSFSKQLRLLHKNGHWIWCDGTITNMLHEEGIGALVSNFSDISEKKSAAGQREFDRNNLHALINNTNDLMWSVDTNYNLITSNQPFDNLVRQASGKQAVKETSTLHLEGFPEEQLRRFKKFYDRALKGETFTEIEYDSSPVEIWSEFSFYPIRKNKEIIGTACYSHDITNRMIAELKLERQNRELTKTNHELDRFVYSVSHDLRSPLTSILGLISFIEEDSMEKETLEHIKLIRNNIERLDGSIKNILSYSQNNRSGLEIQRIDVKKTIAQVIDLLRNGKNSRDIDFQVEIQQEIDFYSDFRRFTIILENLISNAIKHHSDASSERFIKVSCCSSENTLELIVEDNGIGIADDNHEKIFEMFFRISGNTDGSGIGLYILKEAVEKLQGSVKLISKEGIGTTFIVTLKNLTP